MGTLIKTNKQTNNNKNPHRSKELARSTCLYTRLSRRGSYGRINKHIVQMDRSEEVFEQDAVHPVCINAPLW
jgi:hypothetical protein